MINPLDDNTKAFFKEFGVEIPKTEFTVEIDSDIQEDANDQFMVYSAYLRAGFNATEALELVKALLVH